MDKTNSNIVLIGMPGCGKTTIGKILSEKLNMEFIDMDSFIEESQSKSISEIFKKSEEYFRDIESLAIEEVSYKRNVIIATGGGVINRASNIDSLKKNGIIFFIDRPIQNIVRDIDTKLRPLLKKNKDNLYALYKKRYDLYKSYCDIHIINDESIEVVADKILGCIK